MAPSVSLEVNQSSPLWGGLDFDAATKPVLAQMCAALSLDAVEISVLLCDDAEIAELNGQFRDRPKPTNVLSWPSFPFEHVWEPKFPFAAEAVFDSEIGDIALAFETIQAEAEQAKVPLTSHLAHLVLHGSLHCLGFDHETEESAEYMEELERKILASTGLHDPYSESEIV